MAKKKSSPKRNVETARRIWLAGVGAYGRAFSEAQESLAKASDETSRIFEDLVSKGEEIEDAVEQKGRELARSVTPPTTAFDDRIKQMRARLGIQQWESSGDADDIEDRLSAIEAKIDAIIVHLGAGSAAHQNKTATKKSSRKTAKSKSAS